MIRRSVLTAISILLLVHPVAVLQAPPRIGKKGPIEIRAGRPNIWSLEQAHYLLSRMHAENDTLKTKALEGGDLDRNALHGTRVDILREALSVNAGFDQPKAVSNQIALQNYRQEAERHARLQGELDELTAESYNLSLQIAALDPGGTLNGSSESGSTQNGQNKDKGQETNPPAEDSGPETVTTSLSMPARSRSAVLEGILVNGSDDDPAAAQIEQLNQLKARKKVVDGRITTATNALKTAPTAPTFETAAIPGSENSAGSISGCLAMFLRN